MATNPILVDQDKIVAEMEIFAPRDRVFQAITDPAQVRLWSDTLEYELMECEIDPRVGGAWCSVSRPRAGRGDPAHQSFVRWELTSSTKGPWLR